MNARSISRAAFNTLKRDRTDAIGRSRNDIQIIKTNKSEMIHVGEQLLTYLGATDTLDLDKPRFNLYFSVDYGDRPTINVSCHNVSGFKDTAVSMAMMYLMDNGFEATGNYESAEYLYRTFNFRRGKLQVHMEVSVRDDSPTCRKVVIGQETITRDKFKIECD
jgi:hypothetical protein